MKFFAPELDGISANLPFDRYVINMENYHKLKNIYEQMSCVEPGEVDEKREIWLEIPRGTLHDFGDYKEYKEEGIVEDHDEFVKLWKEYYPEEKKWYNFGTAKYRHELFFFLDDKQMCTINENEKQPLSDHRDDKVITEFLDWLLDQVKYETEKLRKDTEEYNRYLERNLPYQKRLGRIKRGNLWNIIGENAVRLNDRLGDKKIEKLKAIVRLSGKEEKDLSMPRMTAEDFYRYCEICYDANDYFKGSSVTLTAKEKYLKMADGRDANLRDIKGDSQTAFND